MRLLQIAKLQSPKNIANLLNMNRDYFIGYESIIILIS